MGSEKQDIKKCELHCLSFQGGHEKVDENWRGHVAWTVTISIFLRLLYANDISRLNQLYLFEYLLFQETGASSLCQSAWS